MFKDEGYQLMGAEFEACKSLGYGIGDVYERKKLGTLMQH